MSRVAEPAGARSPGLPERLALRALAALLRLWGRSWRFAVEGPDPFALRPERGPIGACWHRDLLILAWAFRDRGYCAVASRSRDGDRIAGVLSALGYAEPVRGSSSRGGAAALRGLARRVGDGVPVSLQVDGPRGPAGRVQPGIVHLARTTGVPITPLRFRARPCLRFGSWDRTRLPLPFARVVLHYGEPIPVPREATDAEVEAHCRRLAEALGEATVAPAPGR